MLSPDESIRFQEVLRDLEQKVNEQLEALASWCEPVSPDVSLGRLTRNDAMQDQQMALHQRERLTAQQTRVKAALARIEAGTFGICPLCKKAIEVRRLESAPDAPLCVACLEKHHATRRQ